VETVAAASLNAPNSLCDDAKLQNRANGSIDKPRIIFDMVKPLRFSLFAGAFVKCALPHSFTLIPKG
jgi:hypothetical protein